MNLKLKNYHLMEPKRLRSTAVVAVPSKEDLLEMLKVHYGSSSVNYKGLFGFALCHPKDKYVKKIGAAKALEKAKPAYYYFVQADKDQAGNSFFKFRVNDVEVIFRTHPDGNVVHTSYVNVLKFPRTK